MDELALRAILEIIHGCESEDELAALGQRMSHPEYEPYREAVRPAYRARLQQLRKRKD